jgi:hypothetical protein
MTESAKSESFKNLNPVQVKRLASVDLLISALPQAISS